MVESTPDVQMPSNFRPLLRMSLIWVVAVAGSHFVATSFTTLMPGFSLSAFLKPVSRSVSAGCPAMPRM